MTLPVDPATVDPADIGVEEIVLETDHDTAIELVREAFTDAGFGVPVEFSPSALLNETVGADRDPYYVLGACNPEMADRALELTPRIGALFPCNVVIWAEAPERQRVYHVSIMRIARLVGLAPNDDEWAAIVADTGALVERAVENLTDLSVAVEE